MKIKYADISILVNPDIITIEVKDRDANAIFCKVELTAEQFARCLSRQMHVDANVDVYNLEKIGKKMEHKKHAFLKPEIPFHSDKTEILSQEILKTIPDGWVSDNYFSSQDTFFKKDGIEYAQTTIRRWV